MSSSQEAYGHSRIVPRTIRCNCRLWPISSESLVQSDKAWASERPTLDRYKFRMIINQRNSDTKED